MNFLLEGLDNVPQWFGWYGFISGFVFILIGYQLFVKLRRIYGALFGFATGLGLSPVGSSLYYQLASPVAGAVCGLLLAPVIYKFFVFLTCAVGGAVLFNLPFLVTGLPDKFQIWSMILGAIISGILSLKFEKAFMIFFTSLYGAVFSVIGFVIVSEYQVTKNLQAVLIAISVLSLIGIIIQALTIKLASSAILLEEKRG